MTSTLSLSYFGVIVIGHVSTCGTLFGRRQPTDAETTGMTYPQGLDIATVDDSGRPTIAPFIFSSSQ